MRIGANNPTWVTIGALIALLVLIVDVIFMVTNMIDLKEGALIGALAIARLV